METENTQLVEALRATFDEKAGLGKPPLSKKRKYGDIRSDGKMFRCYIKTVRANQIVTSEVWDTPEVFFKRRAYVAERQRRKTKKFQWQEFTIMLINRLNKYEDTTDIQKTFKKLPR